VSDWWSFWSLVRLGQKQTIGDLDFSLFFCYSRYSVGSTFFCLYFFQTHRSPLCLLRRDLEFLGVLERLANTVLTVESSLRSDSSSLRSWLLLEIRYQ
jgi:hypothetical protein